MNTFKVYLLQTTGVTHGIRWLSVAFLALFTAGFVSAQGPNCNDLNLSIAANDSVAFTLAEVLSNDNDANLSGMRISIRTPFGGFVPGYGNTSLTSLNDVISFSACGYAGERLEVSLSSDDGTCWSYLTFKSANSINLICNLDTAVWCFDPLLGLDPNDFSNLSWYNTDAPPYTLLPVVDVVCGTDAIFDEVPNTVTEVRDYYQELFEKYEYTTTDWIDVFGCESDTSKIIIRETAAYDKNGNRSTCVDSIVVLRLPTFNILSPEKDTVYCEYDTMTTEPGIEYQVWKQLVGLHSDGSYIYYPVNYIDAKIAEANNDDSGEIASALGRSDLVVTADGETFDIFDIVDQSNALIDSIPYTSSGAYRFGPIEVGDQFLSNDGTYITATSDWFFQPGEHGFWVDIAIPCVDSSTYTVCESWPESDCDGLVVEIDNPATGLTDTICMDVDLVNNNKCSYVIWKEEKDFSSSCPRVIKRSFELKNLCDPTATTTFEQWKIYIDTIGPTFESTDLEISYYADGHDCLAEVTLPPIDVSDKCSGVKSVKALIQGAKVSYERQADGSWAHPSSARKVTLAVRDEPYQVVYEAIDSCHNPTFDTSYNIYVYDISRPIVVTDDELTLSTSQEDTWMKMDGLIQSATDNCGVCMQLIRRADWKTACGVDLCNDDIRALRTEAEFDAYIEENGLEAFLSDNEVEEYYVEAYEWLLEDGACCTDADGILLTGWINDIKSYWAQNCAANDDIVIDEVYYGGGWGTKVPICCADACAGGITVEILVMDASCNITKATTTINVNIDIEINKVQEFDTVYLSCHAYDSLGYAGAVSLAMNNSFDSINNILGGLRVGDAYSNGVLSLNNTTVETTHNYTTDSIIATANDTIFDWDEYEDTVNLGAITSTCTNLAMTQTVTANLNDCGVGTIRRVWGAFESGCSSSFNDSLVQVIVIDYSNSLYALTADTATLSLPFTVGQGTDTLNSDLVRVDSDGNVDVTSNSSVNIHTAAGVCRQYAVVGYSDELVDSTLGVDSSTFFYERTYVVRDTCSMDSATTMDVVGILVAPVVRVGVSRSAIQGQIVLMNETLSAADIEVNARLESGNGSKYYTLDNGTYGIDMPEGESLEIEPYKDTDHLEGIDVLDIDRIRKHVAGEELIEDAYEVVAADVNNDGIINIKDVTELQAITLGKTNYFTNNTSWRFYSTLTGEEKYNIESVRRGMKVDFTGVKIGDVVYQSADVSRAASPAQLVTNNVSLEAGSSTTVVLSRADESMSTYQFTLAFDPTIVNVSSIEGLGLTDANWHRVSEGIIRVSSLADVRSDLVLNLEVIQGAILSEAISIIDDRNFNSIALASNNEVLPMTLAFGKSEGFELYQNVPNPTSGNAKIGFMLAEDTKAKISFYDISGKTLKVIEGNYHKGLNEINLNTAELGVTGVVHYRLETTHYTKTRRMVIF